MIWLAFIAAMVVFNLYMSFLIIRLQRRINRAEVNLRHIIAQRTKTPPAAVPKSIGGVF